MRCIRCNYDLRATELRGPCPECGLPASASGIELARLVDIDDPSVPTLRTALDLCAAGAVLALVTAPAAIIGWAIVEAVRHGGPKLGALEEIWFFVSITLGAIVTVSTIALAAGLRMIHLARLWTPEPSGERGLPGFVNVVLASAVTVVVLFGIGWIAAASRGEDSVAPISTTLWVALIPLRAPLLLHAGDYAGRMCRPRGAALPHILGRPIGRLLVMSLWVLAIMLAVATRLFDSTLNPSIVILAIAFAGVALIIEVVASAHLLGSVTAGGRAFRKALAEQQARRE